MKEHQTLPIKQTAPLAVGLHRFVSHQHQKHTTKMKTPAQEIQRPQQMADASNTAENMLKLAMQANELNLQIEGMKNEIRDRESKLTELRKQYASAKPKVLGLLAVLE